MKKGRLEAFSDGVFAIIITIMVLEIKAPHGNQLSDLKELIPYFISYTLSFIYLGIYWNNHHHMMHAVNKVKGDVLWANLHLLFWLSLVPFATSWVGENHFSKMPVAVYGFVLLMAACSYYILQTRIIKSEGKNSLLAKAVGNDLKGKLSILFYVVAISGSYISAWISGAFYVLVACMWLIPDRRIEKIFDEKD